MNPFYLVAPIGAVIGFTCSYFDKSMSEAIAVLTMVVLTTIACRVGEMI